MKSKAHRKSPTEINGYNTNQTNKSKWWEKLSLHEYFEAATYCSKEEWSETDFEIAHKRSLTKK